MNSAAFSPHQERALDDSFIANTPTALASFPDRYMLREPVNPLSTLDQVHRGDKALGDRGEDQRGIGYV